MFDALEPLVAELERAIASLDPEGMDDAGVVQVWEVLGRIERLAAAGRTVLAARVEASAVWARAGFKSAAEWIAAGSGESIARAHDLLDTSARLAVLPTTEAAVRSGVLSPSQASEVTAAAVASPHNEREMLATAAAESLSTLKREAQRIRLAAAGDEESRHARIHAGRHLRSWTDGEGALCLRGRFTAEAGARIMAAVDAWRERIFKEARASGKRDSYDAYGADALERMAVESTGGGTGPKAEIHVRVDLAVLRRGRVAAGERCEIDGTGPVPVRAVRDMLDDAVVRFVLVKGVDVTKVATANRNIRTALRAALRARDEKCVVRGCHRTGHLEHDHCNTDFSAGGETSYENLERLCSWHHALKTRKGFRVEGDRGCRYLVPPAAPPP